MAKILIIEDDLAFSYSIQHLLSVEHYAVEAAKTGQDGLNRLQKGVCDLVMVDRKLPDMPGLELCRRYRASGGTVPLLLLTDNDCSQEKALALDAGADDCLVKPVDSTELTARVRALLRRPAEVEGKTLRMHEIELDTATKRVTSKGEEINLSLKETAILELLMRNPNQRFTADALLSRIWISDPTASVETVRTHIKTLRKKLGDSNEQPLISSTRNLGYRIVDSSAL